MSDDPRRRFLADYTEAADLGLPLPEPPATWWSLLDDAERQALTAEMARIKTAFGHRGGDPDLPSIEGYTLHRKLDHGGQGTVYLATNDRLGRLEAIKVLAPFDAVDPEAAHARFQREVEFLARLQHPGIVPVHQAGRTRAGQPFLAMEYVAGRSLATVLASGAPLPPQIAARLIRDLAQAAHHAHERGVVHRDIKPANVLLRLQPEATLDTATPVLVDFGLALGLDATTRLTRSQDVHGTLFYLAPEQLEPRGRTIGPACDVWALGVTLFELLLGSRPFAGTSGVVMHAILRGDPLDSRAALAGVPADLAAICLRCLERPLARRFASAAALADDLERFLAGQPTWTRPAGLMVRVVRRVRRHGLLVAAAGALVTVMWSGSAMFSAQARERIAQRRSVEALRSIADTVTAPRTLARGLAQTQESLLQALLPYLPADLDTDAGETASLARGKALNMLTLVQQLVDPAAAARTGLTATDIFARLQRERPNDAEVVFELAVAHAGLGRMQAGRNPKEGLEHTREAIRLFEALRQHPQAPSPSDLTFRTAICWNNVANYLAMTEPAASIDPYQQAIELFRTGASESQQCRTWLVKTTSNLALALANSGQDGAAFRRHEEAVAIAREHVRMARAARLQPDRDLASPWLDHDLEHREALAIALNNHGELLCARDRAADAEPLFAEAITHYAALEDAVPSYVEYAWSVAMAKSNVAWAIAIGADRSRDDRAFALLAEAKDWYEMAIARDPANLELQGYLEQNRKYHRLLLRHR